LGLDPNQSQYLYDGAVNGPVTPTDPTATAAAFLSSFKNQQYAADFMLNGGFELLGHEQNFVLGGSYSYETGPSYLDYPLTFAPSSPTLANQSPSADIFDFNPNAPQYAKAGIEQLATVFPTNEQTEYTLYWNTKITLLDPLHLIFGVRFSGYYYRNTLASYCGGFYYEFGLCATVGGPIPGEPNITQKYGDNHFSAPPDASLLYDVSKNISIYAYYTDIYISNAQYLQPDGVTPVPPETGYNEEIGIKWQRPDKKLNASLAIYNIDQTNFPWFTNYGPNNEYASTFGVAGSNYCCYTTQGHSELSQGTDLELAGELTKGWNFSGSYTYDFTKQKGVHVNAQGAPTYSQQPKQLVKIYTTYTFQSGDWLKNLSVGGGLNYQSDTFFAGYEFFNEQKDYALLNLRAAYKLYQHWNIALDVTNATNTKYFSTLGASGGGQFYGQPAAFTLSLKGKW
jgi:outer membrane receptor for ferric coprogen and ferric-rhodotorulic acid